jgi:hypothetical protein
MTLTFHEPDFLGLFKVISGGQCGADRGGLEAAYNIGVLTGGTAPKGYNTAFGSALELGTKFGLTEDGVSGFSNRTRLNVEEADGTVIIVSNIGSPGSHMTLEHARKCHKPVKLIIVEREHESSWLTERANDIAKWIIENRVYVLNVAGNRDVVGSCLHYKAAYELITQALLDLNKNRLLVQKELQLRHG